jgi:hypothetical protein
MRIGLPLVFSLVAASAAPRPTETGDQIGTVSMLPDRSLVMQLRSVECNGMIAENLVRVLPDQRDYQIILDQIGGLRPSETKPILAGPVQPCPSK